MSETAFAVSPSQEGTCTLILPAPWNEPLMEVTLAGRYRSSRLVQPLKAYVPRYVTVEGMLMLARFGQLLNAPQLIAVRPLSSGSVTVARLGQNPKA